jgi:hypothetical protein
MGNRFRNCNLNQRLLFPSSLEEWLPEAHLVRM